VKLGDRVLEADPAWLITTPPNYAPAMATGVVTVYDAARSSFVDAGTPADLGRRGVRGVIFDEPEQVEKRALAHDRQQERRHREVVLIEERLQTELR